MIRTVDTDVVVLAIALCLPIHASELWISFGVGDNFKYIPVHTIAGSLGPKCGALPMFHAFSGCDNTSSFAGKGKKWETWQICESVTKVCRSWECTNPGENWPAHGIPWAICCSALWQNKHSHISWWSEKRSLHQEGQVYWSHATNFCCSLPACQKSILSSGSCLGPVTSSQSRVTFTCWMGLDERTWECIGTLLVRSASSISFLYGIPEMRMCQRLQRKMQVCESTTSMYGSVQMRGWLWPCVIRLCT